MAITWRHMALTSVMLGLLAWAVLGGRAGAVRAEAAQILGQHTVQKGETLYCIGRAYGVHPRAIAEANGLGWFYLLQPGQALKIPAVQWVDIAPGPVCVAQFASPYAGLPASTATAALISTATPPGAAISAGQHVVQKGETLFCIGRAYEVQPLAIAQANALRVPYTLQPGQKLNIPAMLWAPMPPGQTCAAQFYPPFGPTFTPTATGTPPPPPPPTATFIRTPGPTKTP